MSWISGPDSMNIDTSESVTGNTMIKKPRLSLFPSVMQTRSYYTEESIEQSENRL